MKFLAFILLDIYKNRLKAIISIVNNLQWIQMQIKAFHFVLGACSILSLKCVAFYAVGFFGFFAFIFLILIF